MSSADYKLRSASSKASIGPEKSNMQSGAGNAFTPTYRRQPAGSSSVHSQQVPGKPAIPGAPPVYRPQASSGQMKPGAGTPIAGPPPVYRPQAPSGQMKPGVVTPIAGPPPVYRPQAPSGQMKPGVVTPIAGAPPVYRPQASSGQMKPSAGAPIAGAPPVYRPQASSGQMKRAAGAPIAGPPPVYRPQASSGQLKPAGGVSFAPAPSVQHPMQHHGNRPAAGVVQRTVGHYTPGTLAYTTKAMRGLTPAQMKIVQQLHDDTSQHYSVDIARTIATQVLTASNPYEWEVEASGSYVVPDTNVQRILNAFGDPTTDVVKKYDDLASRVRYDVDHNGGFTQSTAADLNLFFEATNPLHFQFNNYLHAAWTDNLDSYSGSKKQIPLYSVMRSEITKDFRAEHVGAYSLNDVLKGVSGRPAEIHHLLYKAKRPELATYTTNLVLSQRSESEKRSGPGQHELMHMVSSGHHRDKFNVLLGDFETQYTDYMLGKGYKL